MDEMVFGTLASEEEKEEIDRIRNSICPDLLRERGYTIEDHPDVIGDDRILRFIRGTAGTSDAEKRVEVFNHNLRIRSKFRLDELRDRAVRSMEKKGPMGWTMEDLSYGIEMLPYAGFSRTNLQMDPSGYPISFVDLAGLRFDEFVEVYGKDAFMDFTLSWLTHRNLQLAMISKNKYKCSIGIVALRSTFSFIAANQSVWSFLRSDAFRQTTIFYHELTKKNYFIDAHWIFTSFYRPLSVFFPTKLAGKNVFASSSDTSALKGLPPGVIRIIEGKESLDGDDEDESAEIQEPFGSKREFWEKINLSEATLPLIDEAICPCRVALTLFELNLKESTRRVLTGSILHSVPPVSLGNLENGCRELIFLRDNMLAAPLTDEKFENAQEFLTCFLERWENNPSSNTNSSTTSLSFTEDEEDDSIDLDSPPASPNSNCSPFSTFTKTTTKMMSQFFPTKRK